jgi:hypothetical protein
MNYRILFFSLLIAQLTQLIHTTAFAQHNPPAPSHYDPRALFPALPLIPAGNTYRAANGEPGPAYWQNRADYTIDATLDDEQQVIRGMEKITYTNHSPHTLSILFLQLEQNAFKPHSKGLDAKLFLDSNVIKANKPFDGGYQIRSISTTVSTSVNTAASASPEKITYDINDTRMRLHLPKPLPPGAKISFTIAYSYSIPRYFYNADFNVNRTDVLPTPNGDIYSIAQWYPRLCVLDDVEGWNTLPYLGNGEFYLEYGDFNVNITAPSAYILSASGELVNPAEVLTALQLQRYNQAKLSEKKVYIRTAEEVGQPSSRPSKPTCTWKFRINNARDFAWTASKSFIWEGIRIDLPSGKKALGISVYPPASKQAESWDRSSEYVKFTIEYFSKKWYEYPYPCAVNVASNLDGMEYPGIVFCSASDTGNRFWEVVNHELGHTWFPMIVGSNERKYAWMDEGFNTFIDNMASASFDKGQFTGYLSYEPPAEELFADSLVPILTRPDAIKGDEVFPVQYLKTAYLLRTLRNQIIGPDRFDEALRKYIHDWAFKHPTPWDFFRSIDNSTGEDLSWFWKAFFLENYRLDQRITDVTYVGNDPSKGADIHIDNLEKAAMPLVVDIVTASGKKERHVLPVEIWEFDYRYVLRTTTTEPIKTVVIDPDHIYPDVDRSNNIWQR